MARDDIAPAYIDRMKNATLIDEPPRLTLSQSMEKFNYRLESLTEQDLTYNRRTMVITVYYRHASIIDRLRYFHTLKGLVAIVVV